jgi:hypothetical protein
MTKSAVGLFQFLKETMRDEEAARTVSSVELSLGLADKGWDFFPREPMPAIDQHAVASAISLATGITVAEIAVLSRATPFVRAPWMTQKAFDEALHAALRSIIEAAWDHGAWLSQIITQRFGHILDVPSPNFGKVGPLKTFLNNSSGSVSSAVALFTTIADERLNGFMGGAFRECVASGMRRALRDYLGLRFVGDPAADELELIVKMMPFIVPICAMDEKKETWIVITA